MDTRLTKGVGLLRPRYRPTLRGRTATQQLARLVAQNGRPESHATVLQRHGRRAHPAVHDPLLPLPARGAAQDATGPLDLLGRAPRRRQPASRLLALQPDGRALPARTGAIAPPPNLRLGRHLQGTHPPHPTAQPALRQPGTRLQGTRRLLPASARPATPPGPRNGTHRHPPHHRHTQRTLGGRRTLALRHTHRRFRTMHRRRNDVLARNHPANHRATRLGRLAGARSLQRTAHADHRPL